MADDWLIGYRAAGEALEKALVACELPSRASPGSAFSLNLVDASGGLSRTIALEGDEGRLPGVFWFHYAAAAEKLRRRHSLATIDDDCEVALRSGDYFEFRDTGLIEGQSSEGVVERVEVLLSGLPRGTATPIAKAMGRPRRPAYDDSAIADQAEAAISAGDGQANAVARLAPSMSGGGTLDSKKKRLRDRLAARRKSRP